MKQNEEEVGKTVQNNNLIIKAEERNINRYYFSYYEEIKVNKKEKKENKISVHINA